MSAFTASNGGTIERSRTGRIAVTDNTAHRLNENAVTTSRTAFLDPEHVEALREFFLHERDEQLARWRHPEHPDYVAYPIIGGVLVVREFDGHVDTFEEDDIEPSNWIPKRVAHAYREAHLHAQPEQEPKSWQDAKPGEVWVLDIADIGESAYGVVMRTVGPYREPMFQDAEDGALYALPSSSITAGRRIWPEPEVTS